MNARHTLPRYTRPFNYEQAKNGAPIATECGTPVTIFKWDIRLGQPIIGCYGDQDQIGRWDLDGTFSSLGCHQFALVMLPLGMLDGLPVFVGDILLGEHGQEVEAEVGDKFFTGCFWRWPAYPLCQLSADDLVAIAAHSPDAALPAKLRHVADSVLRDAVQRGQVKIVEIMKETA